MSRIGCDDFRKFLDAYLDDEFDARDRAEFDAHVALCGPCRRHLEQQVWFRRAVRPHLQRPPRMPDEVRARLRSRVRAATRPARTARMIGRVAMPLPALAAAGAVFLLVTPLTGFTPVVEEVVDQHCQRVPIEVPTPEAAEVDQWFRDKLPFELAAPRFEDESVVLLGGRLSRFGGGGTGIPTRHAAYLVYGVGPHKLTVMVFDGHDLDLSDRGGIREVNGRRLSVHPAGSYRVAVYERGPLTYAFTSDLPETELLRLVGNAR